VNCRRIISTPGLARHPERHRELHEDRLPYEVNSRRSCAGRWLSWNALVGPRADIANRPVIAFSPKPKMKPDDVPEEARPAVLRAAAVPGGARPYLASAQRFGSGTKATAPRSSKIIQKMTRTPCSATLNERSRKTLDFHTPAEMFSQIAIAPQRHSAWLANDSRDRSL
jgi:hypothetical protein